MAGYLGSGYIVESSRRPHPRPAASRGRRAREVQVASRGPRLGVNVDADFEPLYIISPEKKSTVSELKGLLKDVDELYLATDGDREGEAIAWHLLEALKPRSAGQADGLPRDHPGRRSRRPPPTRATWTTDLVDAQETRRILDRLYGYEV